MLEDDTPYTPEDEEPDDADAPYSPGEGEDKPLSPGCSEELQRKVDKLNRMINDIEERKQKIDSGIMSPPQVIFLQHMGKTKFKSSVLCYNALSYLNDLASFLIEIIICDFDGSIICLVYIFLFMFS